MELQPEIISELRAMFKDGATPARMVEYIRLHEGAKRPWFAVVMQYFFAAFRCTSIRVPARVEEYGTCSQKLVKTSPDVLHDIILQREHWENEESEVREEHWFDALTAADLMEHLEQVDLAAIPELANSLEHIDAQGQEYIKTRFASACRHYEQVRILSHLAERLQQKVLELESQQEQQSNSPGDGNSRVYSS